MKSIHQSILYPPARTALSFLLRMNPFYRGGVRIAQTSFAGRLARDLGLVAARLRRGPRLLIGPNEYSGRAVYFTGDYDRRITWICRRLLRPGDCFLDIGACFGEVGLWAAQFVGPSGQVHLFEPQPKSANLIRISAELNSFRHVLVHEIALSDRDGTVDFFVPQGHTGMGSLVVHEDREVDILKVPVRNAGSYLRKLQLPPIRAIKIDVEGHEERVIAGAMDFLRSNKPATIIFECHDDGQSFFGRGIVKLLLLLGYDLFQIRQKIWLRVQLKKLKSSNMVEPGFDFVALSTSPEHQDIYSLLGID